MIAIISWYQHAFAFVRWAEKGSSHLIDIDRAETWFVEYLLALMAFKPIVI
jgi:hypothetical protein